MPLLVLIVGDRGCMTLGRLNVAYVDGGNVRKHC